MVGIPIVESIPVEVSPRDRGGVSQLVAFLQKAGVAIVSSGEQERET